MAGRILNSTRIKGSVKVSPNLSFASSLMVHLDAGVNASYPGSGSTWYDLSGNNRNATLFNTPTYNSGFGGYFNFLDSSLEYATIPNIGNISTWTVEAWFRLTTALTSKVSSIVTNQFDLVSKLNFSIGANNQPTNANLTSGFFDGNWRNVTGTAVSTATWY